MIIGDENGNELLKVIKVDEAEAETLYTPITHALVVVKIGQEYLMGWNKWRKDWEIFGGCKEEGESLRECIIREGYEELGLENVEYSYVGLMKLKLAPSYFSPDWREEYGGLFGITLSEDMLEVIEKYRTDKEEIEKLEFYSRINKGEKIAVMDEKLLDFWKK